MCVCVCVCVCVCDMPVKNVQKATDVLISPNWFTRTVLQTPNTADVFDKGRFHQVFGTT